MNIFELNILASPVAGLLGGVAASSDRGAIQIAASAVGGLAVGIGLYFGIFGLGILVEKIANYGKPKNAQRMNRGASIIGNMILLPMLVLPFLSWFVAHAVFNAIF